VAPGQLLTVGVSPSCHTPLLCAAAGVKQESGAAAAEVLMEGLVLLREQEHSSCYWLCAACDRKFHTASDFNVHLETCHEQLVLAKQQLPHKGPCAPVGPSAGPAAAAGKAPGAAQQPALPFSPNSMPPPASYVSCGKCQAPVVGMYYTRIPQAHKQCPQPPAASPGEEDAVERMRNICMKCYRELAALMGEAGADRSYSKVSPHAPSSPGTAWSESGSEFISTRDSFSSCGEDGTSSGSLSDTEPSTAAAAASSMQVRQYDAPGRASALSGAQPGLMSPDHLKQKRVLCPPWRFQQQRAVAWSSQSLQEACAGPSRRQGLRPGEQQALEAQQQQQAATAAPGPGIFVFGSNHNSTHAAGSSSSVPNSSVPAAGAGVAGAAGSGAATATSSQQQQQQASSSASSPAQQQGPPGSTHSSLAAYWQQQQLLLCSTDAAAAELLEGLDVVQKVKQLDSKQHRHHAGVAAQRQSCGPAPGAAGGQLFPPGPVTGTKRSAASAAAPAPAPALAAAGLCLAPAGAPPFQAPPAVNTGSAAAAAAGSSSAGPADASGGAAAGGSYDLAGCAGADSGTPSAGNRTWRDWLLPKKLLQWNDDEGAELLQDESPHASDDDSDDVIVRGVDQGRSSSDRPGCSTSSSRAQEQQRLQDGGSSSSSRCQQSGAEEAAASGVGGSSSSGRVGGCSAQDGDQQQGRRVPTVVVTELSDDAAAAADYEASDQATGSAPCSPRTPTAHDSCRGAPDTASSASQTAAAAAAACDTLSTHACSAPDAAAAAATGATGAAVDSLGACLAAAAPAVLVDEVMRCMQHLYDSDPDVADETLLCLVDFLQRKLNPKGYKRVNCDAAAAAVAAASRRSASNSALNLEQVSPAAAAAAAAAGVGADDAALAAELLVAPEVAFLCPRAMRAAMCCLGSDDLQMALAYIVRQSGAPLAGANVEIDSTCGSSAGGSMGSSSGAGSVTGDDDDGADSASQTDSQESEEESGCMALFQLYHLDEVAFEQLVAQLWPGELRLSDTAADAGPAAAPAAAGKAAGGKHGRSVQQQAGKGAASSTKGGSSSSGGASSQAHRQKDRLEPVLLVSPWWLEHLRQSSKNRDPAGDAEADTRVLRWVYGNIESAQAEELASRQASLRGGLDRTAALLELYEGLAEAWRRMQRVADRQRRLEQLRSRVKVR